MGRSANTPPSTRRKNRVVVVTKQTAYQRRVEEQRDPRAIQLMEQGDPTVNRWLQAHQDHQRTLEEVERHLSQLGAKIWRVEGPFARFDAQDAQMVVTVGGDGTLLAASHHVGAATPILGINSSPDSSVGFFCAGQASGNLKDLLTLAWEGALPSVCLARMQIAINGRIRSRRVLNEALFCHAIPAATSSYLVAVVEQSAGAELPKPNLEAEEAQRSSGFWVGTAAGSTAAIRSAGGKVLPFSSRRLQLVVREPYVGLGPAYELVRVVLQEGQAVMVRSKMDRACVFVDGPFERYAVTLGDVVTFKVSDEPLTVLGLKPRREVADVEQLMSQR